MNNKLFVIFIGCFLLFFSRTAYCWSENNDDEAQPTEVYYSSPSYSDVDEDQEEAVIPREEFHSKPREIYGYESYSSRLPKHIATNEKTIVVDPHVHAWGAYNAKGTLIRAGLATAGAKWCEDLGRPCRTQTGVFHIRSLGNSDCVSNEFPLDVGGAPMPYCMYFNGGQALHGSYEVKDANVSHGCVRIHVQDAEWLRFDFAQIGTKVIVKSY